jgi:hypothetical protein
MSGLLKQLRIALGAFEAMSPEDQEHALVSLAHSLGFAVIKRGQGRAAVGDDSKSPNAVRQARHRERRRNTHGVTEALRSNVTSNAPNEESNVNSNAEVTLGNVTRNALGDNRGSLSLLSPSGSAGSLSGSSSLLPSPEGGPDAGAVPADCLSQPSTIPPPPEPIATPRTYNAAVLVDHFTAGVNSEGGVWVCSRGKPWTDLAAALQPHVAADGRPGAGTALPKVLGRRWLQYCGGFPRDGFKAAAWLSEGAPEKPRQTAQTAASEAQEAAAKARRAEEAKQRERDHDRRKREELAVPPPPEALALATALAAPSDTRVRARPRNEQLDELEEMAKAGGER